VPEKSLPSRAKRSYFVEYSLSYDAVEVQARRRHLHVTRWIEMQQDQKGIPPLGSTRSKCRKWRMSNALPPCPYAHGQSIGHVL
jgi:hypothetical protein